MNKYHKHWEIKTKQWRTMYMRGFDDALSGRRFNPYNRSDFRAAWDIGYKKAMRNEAPPKWANEHRYLD